MCGMVKPDRFDMSCKSSVAMCTLGVVAGIVIYKLHIAQKWDAAFVGTLAPFWYLAGVVPNQMEPCLVLDPFYSLLGRRTVGLSGLFSQT